MAQDWPSPHHHEPRPLPAVEDLSVVWEGYDRDQVESAFDAFYRHIARIDSTLRTLESVEIFRDEAADLRAELRSIRAAGWSPYPRGYALAPERTLLGSVPDAVPRIALEVIFLVVVAAVVTVADFTSLQIVAAMAAAAVLVCLVELVAARDRRSSTPIPASAPPLAPAAAPPPPPAAAAPAAARAEDARAEDGVGWAAFASPAAPDAVMGLSDEDQPAAVEAERVGDTTEESLESPEDEPAEQLAPAAAEAAAPETPAVAAEPEPEPAATEPEPVPAEPEPVAVASAQTEFAEQEQAAVAPPTRGRRRFLRRQRDEEREPDAASEDPKHVRVLPAQETAVAAEDTLPPWERGFDETGEFRP